MYRAPIAVAACLMLVLAGNALAQEQKPLTPLQELIEQLEKNNPEIRAACFRLRQRRNDRHR